jgi:hypothetical protein
VSNTRGAKPRSDGAREPASRFFDHHGHGQLLDQAGKPFDNPAEIAIALGLDDFHGRVQMHTQRVRAHRAHQLLDLVAAHADRLNGTDVAQ